MHVHDAIVLGVGAMGSAACWQLARRGHSVLGLEQFGLAHDRGSSHGQTRIIRKAYFEHPDYIPLLHRAYGLWHALEAESGRALFQRTGLLLIGPPDGPVLTGVRRAAAQHGLQFEHIAAGQVERRFRGLAVDSTHGAIFERDAGFLRVEQCVQTLVDRAAAAGATIVTGQRVMGWSVRGSEVRVETEEGAFAARRLVITAGPWAGRVLAELRLPLKVRRKVQFWMVTDNPAHEQVRGFPVFAFDLPEGFFYGFPAIEPGVMKTALHTGGDVVDDPSAPVRELLPDDLPPVQRFAAAHLPGVRPHAERHSICLYTMTPDEHFIIDRHPQHPQVVVAAGFSGHGFKFAPIVGSILADLVETGQTTEPIGFLSATRAALR